MQIRKLGFLQQDDSPEAAKEGRIRTKDSLLKNWGEISIGKQALVELPSRFLSAPVGSLILTNLLV